jgi:CheY-like chemotaxis protein
MNVLIASSSGFRRGLYRQTVESLGHEVALATGGVDCAARLVQQPPDLLVLEAPLLWGGSDGVLEILETLSPQPKTRVIVVAVGPGSVDWFQLSRFRVDDLLFRIPTAQELQRAIGPALIGAAAAPCDATLPPPAVARPVDESAALESR